MGEKFKEVGLVYLKAEVTMGSAREVREIIMKEAVIIMVFISNFHGSCYTK